jgi:hypothetical protein
MQEPAQDGRDVQEARREIMTAVFAVSIIILIIAAAMAIPGTMKGGE